MSAGGGVVVEAGAGGAAPSPCGAAPKVVERAGERRGRGERGGVEGAGTQDRLRAALRCTEGEARSPAVRQLRVLNHAKVPDSPLSKGT